MDNIEVNNLITDRVAILNGLTKTIQKEIDSKYFYDSKGSELFDEITKLKEYYPTKKELTILKEKKQFISKILPKKASVIEFGSGSSQKILSFLKAIDKPQEYYPIDISEYYLKKNLITFTKKFPLIKAKPICSDFLNTQNVKSILDKYIKGRNKLIGFFPGSTIGNFRPFEAKRLLKNFSQILSKNNYLVVGVDLIKKKTVLEKAYNDKRGVTRKFNLNLLDRLNKEMDANFIKSNFEHLAFFNNKYNRIEMHILSKIKQTVKVLDKKINFKKGETIHTENSYKYTVNGFSKILKESGFKKISVLTDKNKYFGIFVYKVL